MSEIARDSGIIADDDSTSETSSMRTNDEYNQLSYVQKLRKRFELLSKENEREFHSNCNWWLEDEEEDQQHETIIEPHQQDESDEIVLQQDENVEYRNQISVNSQKSSKSYKLLQNNKSSEDDSEHQRTIVLQKNENFEYQNQSSVNSQKSSKSYKSLNSQKSSEDSSEQQRPNFNPPEITLDTVDNDDDEVFESADDIEEEIEAQYLRRTQNKLTFSRPASITSQISNFSTTSKLYNIIRELQENEENYVRSLKNGIKNYMTVMNGKDLPKSLRGQKHRVFGNIESIYKFHANEFLPKLLQCNDDVEQIAELFTSYVTKDYFYGYVIYAINRKKSELSCNYHVHYWKQIQNQCGDRLGINSFLLQPIQRLPRYQLLLNEIIKDLSKDLENTKQAIAACCVAEKNIQRLLDTVNESMSINDVRNCFDIDILCQGKFKKMNEFEIYDWELRRRFRGKVFLFERCVVYTEALDREYLEYRGHYESEKLGIIYKEGKSKFKLFAKKRGCKEVEFHSDLNTVVDWKTAITAMLMDFVAAEKKRYALNSIRRASSTRVRSIPDSVRSSILSNLSNQSNFSIGSSFRSSTSSNRSSSTTEPRTSMWYV